MTRRVRNDFFDIEQLYQLKQHIAALSDGPLYATPEYIFQLQNARSLHIIAMSLLRIADKLDAKS